MYEENSCHKDLDGHSKYPAISEDGVDVLS